MNDSLGVMDQDGAMTYVNEKLCSMIITDFYFNTIENDASAKSISSGVM